MGKKGSRKKLGLHRRNDTAMDDCLIEDQCSRVVARVGLGPELIALTNRLGLFPT